MEAMVSILDLKKISAQRAALEVVEVPLCESETLEQPETTLGVEDVTSESIELLKSTLGASEKLPETKGSTGLLVSGAEILPDDTEADTPPEDVVPEPQGPLLAFHDTDETISEEITVESYVPGVGATQDVELDHTYDSSPNSQTIVCMKETIKSLERKNEIMVGIIDDLLACVSTVPKEILSGLLALGLEAEYLCKKSIKSPKKPRKPSFKVKKSQKTYSLPKRKRTYSTVFADRSVDLIPSDHTLSDEEEPRAKKSKCHVMGVKNVMCQKCNVPFLNGREELTHKCSNAVDSSKEVRSSIPLIVPSRAQAGKPVTQSDHQAYINRVKKRFAPLQKPAKPPVAPGPLPFVALQCLKCKQCFLSAGKLQSHSCAGKSPNRSLLKSKVNHSAAQQISNRQSGKGNTSMVQMQCQRCSTEFTSVKDLLSHRCVSEGLNSSSDIPDISNIKLENISEEDMGVHNDYETFSKQRPKEFLLNKNKPVRKGRKLTGRPRGKPPGLNGNEPFPCDLCEKVLHSKTCFYEHKAHSHSDHESAINCSDCLRTFFTQVGYKVHLDKCRFWMEKGLGVQRPIKTEQVELQAQEIDIGGGSLEETLVRLGLPDETASQLAQQAALHDVTPPKELPVLEVNKSLLRPFLCPDCGNRFVRQSALLHHVKKFHDGVRYPGKAVTTDQEGMKLTGKRGTKATKPPVYAGECICEKCGEVFKTWASLRNHMRVHENNGSVICKVCKGEFNSKFMMKRHVQAEHPESLSHMCDVCGEGFHYPNTLKNHMFRKHEGRPSHTCKVCSKGFSRIESYRQHMLRHTNVKNYSCKVCPDKFFYDQSQLLYHNLVHHTKERKYQCDFCPKKFNLSCNRSSHVRNVHLKERKFSCEFCDRAFFSGYSLRMHHLTHTREKPHKCGSCHLWFQRRDRMVRHMKLAHSIIIQRTERGASQKITLKIDSKEGQPKDNTQN